MEVFIDGTLSSHSIHGFCWKPVHSDVISLLGSVCWYTTTLGPLGWKRWYTVIHLYLHSLTAFGDIRWPGALLTFSFSWEENGRGYHYLPHTHIHSDLIHSPQAYRWTLLFSFDMILWEGSITFSSGVHFSLMKATLSGRYLLSIQYCSIIVYWGRAGMGTWEGGILFASSGNLFSHVTVGWRKWSHSFLVHCLYGVTSLGDHHCYRSHIDSVLER